MDIPIPLQEALRDSITSGTFVDTTFWVFSKRNSKLGRVGEPKALFVSGHVVRSVPRLAALLDQKETKESLRTKFPVDRKPYTGDYDYDCDSDLDEDEYCDFSDFEDSKVVPEKGKGDKSGPGTEDIKNSDGKENSSSDVISISDMDSLFSDSSETRAEAEIVATPTPAPAHIGTVVVVEDVAFVTFQALLHYLYTDEIEFAPWGSKERRKARVLEEISEPYEAPKPSPKSMYRLADKYDIPKLKELALQRIQRDLSKCDIVEEVFSEYTSRYPELRNLELKQLARELVFADSGAARRVLKDKIKAYNRGQLPHAKDILPALYELIDSNGTFKEIPARLPAPPDKSIAGSCWEGLKTALTWSLTSGTFLDRQFYALDSKSGSGAPRVRPVYFWSKAGDGFLPKDQKYSSRIGPSTEALLQSVDDYDSDINYKGSEVGISVDACPRLACVPEDPSQACKSSPTLLLNFGTVKTWSAILFYAYTSRIAFSTIGSSGTTAKSREETPGSLPPFKTNPPKNSRATTRPPLSRAAAIEPCSPKAVYALANKIGLTRLCNLAFDNIKSQLREENIVRELFSSFTANHECIMKMEHDLFHSRFKSPVGRSSLLDIIRDSPLGENPHREVAMELVFDRTIDDCQERMLAKAKKSSQADPAVQPSSHDESTSTLTPITQPATEPDSPEKQLPQPSKVQSPDLKAQPYPELSALSPTPQRTASSYPPPTPSTNVFRSPFSAWLTSDEVTLGVFDGPPRTPSTPQTTDGSPGDSPLPGPGRRNRKQPRPNPPTNGINS